MNTFASSRFRRSHAASIAAACALALCAGIARAQVTTTWTGGAASGDWSTAGNWNGGTPTTSGTWALTFSGSTQTTSTNTIGGTSDTITLSSLLFSNTTVGMTLNRLDSRTLTLANGATVTTTAAASAITNTINIPLNLLGTSTFSVASNANLSLGAASALTGGTLVKTGAGTLNFDNGGTNTTNLRLTGGNLSFNSASAMSAFDGRALTTGSGAGEVRFANGTTSLQFAFEAGTTVRGFGSNSPVFSSGTFNTATTASADVTVIIGQSGGTGAEIRGVIQDNLGGRKVGLRAWRSSNPTTVVLTAANTYTGQTQMTGAVVLQLGNGGTTGSLSPSSSISGDAGSTLAFNRSNTVTQGTDFNSTLGGSFNVSQLGSGTLVFNAATTYTGTTSINAGTLRIGSGGTTGSLSTSSVITGSAGGTLAFNRSNTVTQGTDFNSVIGGAINVAQVGSGTLSLGGVNTHSGTTSVSNGTLALANVLAVQNSTLDTGTFGSQAVTFTVAGTNTYTVGGLQGSNGLAIGANTISIGGNNASTTFSGALTGAGGLTKTGTGGIALSGSNTYTGTTTINAGTLQIGASGTAGSLSTSSVITGSAGATLAFNRSNTVTQGTDFNSTLSGPFNVTQLGTGTLVFNAATSYTGTTSINAGTLQIGAGGTAGSLSTSSPISVASGATLAFNRIDAYDGDVPNTISGAGRLSLLTGTLTLTGSNSYSGGTQVNAGVLRMGGAQALGSSNAAVIVASGAALDLAGVTGTNTNPYALTINGSGISGGGALTNSGAAATFFGPVTLGSDSSIFASGSDITLGAASGINRALGITGNFVLTVGGATSLRTVRVYGNVQTASVTVTSGQLRLESDNSFAGGLTINGGAAIAKTTGALGGSGTGAITLGDTSGSANATLNLGLDGTYANPIVVRAGNTGVATLDNFANFTVTASGSITLNKGLTLDSGNAGKVLTLSGPISGVGGLTIQSNGTSTATLSGSNTFSGPTTMSSAKPATLQIGNVWALQNSTLDTGAVGSQAVTFTVAGNNSYVLGGLQGSDDLAIGANTLVVGGNGSSTTFAGAISGNGGGLTKSGTGVLTLSGANTYSGLTTVSAGVLATTADNRIPSGSSIVMSGGTLQFGGNNTVTNISGTAGAIDVGISRLTSSVTTASTFSGSLVGNRTASAGQGPSGFWKSGSGTLTLAGNVALSVDNSIAQGFNNPLQVNAGELVLAGTTTLTNVENRINGTGAVLRVTSGSHSFNTGTAASIVGGVTIQDGSFIVDNGFAAVRGMSIGFGSVAGATNVVTINGGTLSSPSLGITLGNNTGATQTPTLNLNGGVLETNSIANGGMSANSVTFNGGTLRMLGTGMIPSGTNNGGNFLALNVGNGGAILDTGTFANTISRGLVGVGSGGLTKLGSAQLTLSGTSTYTGATTISAGTLAFDRIAALGSTSGVGIASGAGLTYTGTTGALDRAITVTGGTGTVRNAGGGTLTLSGTLTKDGTVLRLTGGSFNVTGQIVGSSSNSDLLVDGTSTVTLSAVNTYNGPTFVNQASNLILGVNDAIPSGSIVALGDATTTGTLTLGSFSDAIGGLAFGASGGTLRMAASAAGATAQLTAASGTMNLSGGTLDLTGSGTSAGYYRLLSAQSITNSFTNITGTTGAYQILTTSTSIDYQQRAVLGAVSVTNPVVSIITGGSAAFTYTVANNALAGGAGLTFTGAGLSNVVGTSLGSVNAADTSGAIAGLVFTGTSIGSGQQGTFTVSDPSAFGSTSATGIVSVNVLNHSLASFEASDTATLSLDLGTYDTASGWTSGSGSLGFSLWNIASGGFTDADTAGLALYDVVFTSGSDVFSTGLTNFANLASGTFNGYMASVLSPGSLTEGTYQGVYTLKFRDQQNLSGAANTRDLTLTANVIVVPEPGALALAGIGIGLAGWLLCRRQT